MTARLNSPPSDYDRETGQADYDREICNPDYMTGGLPVITSFPFFWFVRQWGARGAAGRRRRLVLAIEAGDV